MEIEATRRRAEFVDGPNTEYLVIERVREAERAFVERRFRKALNASIVAIKYAAAEQMKNPHQSTGNLQLHSVPPNSFKIAERPLLLVDASSPISPADKIAAILLQSCYELRQTKRNNANKDVRYGIETFQDLYYGSRRNPFPLGLGVAIVWIQYCHARGWHHHALELSAEILHVMLSRKGFTQDTEESCLELLLFLSTKSLPYSDNPAHARLILKAILSQAWTPVPWKFEIMPNPNSQVMPIILSSLDDVLSRHSGNSYVKRCVQECRLHVERLLDEIGREECISKTRNGSNTQNAIPCSSPDRQMISRPLPPLTCPDWQKNAVRKLVHYVHTNVIQPLYTDEERWVNRGRIAFSVFVTYLAWKRRRRVAGATQAAGRLVLFPFLEIVEALLPGKHSQEEGSN